MRVVSIDSVRHDARDACRALRSSRSYAAWVVCSLAIGMAAAIAALALLNATLALPFAGVTQQDRLVRIAVSRHCDRPNCATRMASVADYHALRTSLSSISGLAGYATDDIAVTIADAQVRRAVFASANYFDVIGARPTVGRGFTSDDEQGAAEVVVLAHSTWLREFGGASDVIGRTIRIGDRFAAIVGVAPDRFTGIDRDRPTGARVIGVGRPPDLWLPLWLSDRPRDLSLVGRLRDGVTFDAAHAEVLVIANQRVADVAAGERARVDVSRVWRVNPRNWPIGVIVVMPIPILVLAIACVNAANLMLARGSQRGREIAIRLAIGAPRLRIIRQLLFESAILSGAATAVALPLAWWALQVASSPLNVPIPFDPTVLVLTLLLTAVTTMACGLAPAVRVSGARPSTIIGPVGARNDVAPHQSRVRRALVVAQVALSLGLLATGSQLVSTVRAQAVSGGTSPDHLLIARFDWRQLTASDADRDRFYQELVAGGSRLPGVEAVGLARHSSVWTFGQGAGPASVTVWRPTDKPDQGTVTIGGFAGADLFDAVGLRVTAGRGFTDADRRGLPQVAIVNETAARRLVGPAIGSRIRVAPRNADVTSSIDVEVVGVIEAAVEPRLEQGEPPIAKVYLPSPLEPEPALALYLKTTDRAALIAPAVRELTSRIDVRVPIQAIGSLAEFNERSYATQLWLARAAAVLGGIGLLLATAGLYGVLSYVVAMRSREMAIRMAIGADPRAILSLVLGQSMRVAAMGVVIGAAGALAASAIIQSEYHGIRQLDARAFAGAVTLFLGAMLVASAVPARCASRVDPIENLRDA